MQRGLPGLVGSFDVGTVVEQYFDDVGMIGEHGVVERRGSAFGMLRVHIGARLKQKCCDIPFARPRGVMQRSAAQGVSRVYGNALRDQQLNRLEVAGARGLVEFVDGDRDGRGLGSDRRERDRGRQAHALDKRLQLLDPLVSVDIGGLPIGGDHAHGVDRKPARHV